MHADLVLARVQSNWLLKYMIVKETDGCGTRKTHFFLNRRCSLQKWAGGELQNAWPNQELVAFIVNVFSRNQFQSALARHSSWCFCKKLHICTKRIFLPTHMHGVQHLLKFFISVQAG
jgi:hypothetical protein